MCVFDTLTRWVSIVLTVRYLKSCKNARTLFLEESVGSHQSRFAEENWIVAMSCDNNKKWVIVNRRPRNGICGSATTQKLQNLNANDPFCGTKINYFLNVLVYPLAELF